jgi:fibronectin type 3 domain-containing protein
VQVKQEVSISMSKRSSILLVTSCVLMLGSFGCGSDSVQAPGDTVPPVAVVDLDASVVTQNGAASVELVWTDSPEADLAGYRVYRSFAGEEMTLVGVETAATFRDGTVRGGASYVYEVSAFDDSGNESPRVNTGLVWVQGDHQGPRGGGGIGD